MSAVYIAARYSRRLEAVGIAAGLRWAGHTVTARWLLGKHELPGGGEPVPERDWAVEDLRDIDVSNVLVSLTEAPGVGGRARGGRHVEFGYAIGTGHCRLILLGPRENVFHHLAPVEQVDDVPALLRLLGAARS